MVDVVFSSPAARARLCAYRTCRVSMAFGNSAANSWARVASGICPSAKTMNGFSAGGQCPNRHTRKRAHTGDRARPRASRAKGTVFEATYLQVGMVAPDIVGPDIDGVTFTFYVPTQNDQSPLVWHDLRERDEVVRRVIEVKGKYPGIVKSNVGSLELMMSDVAILYTGENGEPCILRNLLPLYMGDGGRFERTFCCYGNDVDCSRCGAYAVFNSAYHRMRGEQEPLPTD